MLLHVVNIDLPVEGLRMAPGANAPLERLHVKIGGMQCSFCVKSIQKAISRMDGVREVGVNLSHEETLIVYNPEIVTDSELKGTLRSLGYTIRDPNKLQNFEQEAAELRRHGQQLLVAGLLVSIATLMMITSWLGFRQSWFPVFMLTLTVIMIFGVGWSILKMAFASLRRGILNQHVLMEFGAFGGLIGGLIGFFIQPWPIADFMAAAIYITGYHILSGFVSLHVRTRSSQAIRKLMELQPATARIARNGVEEEVPIEKVQLGDHVRIRPGESSPVDGIIIEGHSAVDQSLITGEPIPIMKKAGDEVIGGSINQYGTLLVQVTRIGEESFLQQVVRSVQEARTLKPGIILVVEKVLNFFVPAVLLAAALAFSIWTVGAWVLVGEPNTSRAIFATLAVLVMGYPCALGMATPLAMIRGGGIAAQQGILMRSGEAFQVFKDVQIVVLDKTGTITAGKPKVVSIIPGEAWSKDQVLTLAAAVEHASEHPLGRAIVEHARNTGLLEKIPAIKDFQAIPGRGIKAVMNDYEVRVGNPQFLRKEGIDIRPLQQALQNLERGGHTIIGVAAAGEFVGIIAITDPLKADSVDAIAQMKTLGLEPIILTGDTSRTAQAIAKQVGITKVFAEVLPQDKAHLVRDLQQNGTRVAMVGDGINDAPALMQADVGIAIGAGTDIAIESADIVLVNSRLSSVVDAYHIARTSYRKTQQNVALAFTFNGVGVPLAITGLVHPALAMAAMAASVSAVLLNSFGGRLLPKSKLEEKPQPEVFTQAVFHVPTIHCDGCVRGLKDKLGHLDGVVSVEGDAQEKTLNLTYDSSKQALETLEDAITVSGHKITRI